MPMRLLPPLIRCLLDTALLAAVFALALWLNTANNDFSVRYHPDEGGKVRQLTGEAGFNFNHPHLMLTTARGINAVAGPTAAERDAVSGTRRGWSDVHNRILIHGRWASALLAAGAVIAIMLGIRLHYGRLPGLIVGLTLALDHGLIARAHYFKEDPALVFGLAVAFLGLCLMWRRRGWRALGPATVTGIGCGLAAAGKYVGIVPAVALLPFAVCGPFFGSLWSRVRGTQWIAIVGFAVFCAVNFEGVFPWEPMSRGFDREVNHVTTEHTGLVSDPYGWYYADVLMRETKWPAWLGAALFLGWLAAKRRLSGIDAVLLAFPLGFAALLVTAAVQFDRYLLPTVVFFQSVGGLGLALVARDGVWPMARRLAGRWLGDDRPRAASWVAGAVPAVALVTLTLPSLHAAWSCVAQFGDDSRDRANAWMLANLPPNSFIVADGYAKIDRRALREQGHRLGRYELSFGRYSLDYLKENGATHVVVCNLTYDRFLHEHRTPTPRRAAEIGRRTEGYRRLFAEEPVVWRSAQRVAMPYYVNPVVTIFRIDGEAIDDLVKVSYAVDDEHLEPR